METLPTSGKIHPLYITTAAAVILACLCWIANMMGLLPNSGTPPAATSAPVIAATTTVTAATAPVSTTAITTPPPATDKPVTVKKTTPKKITHPQKHSEPLSIPQSVPLAPPPTCYECGVIESVRDFENPGQPSGLGAAAGALLGGVLGHQVGDGDGNKLATIAGAIGGGFAGNAIEKNSRAETSSEITVRMEDGTSVRLILEAQHWRIGDKVRVVNRNLVAR